MGWKRSASLRADGSDLHFVLDSSLRYVISTRFGHDRQFKRIAQLAWIISQHSPSSKAPRLVYHTLSNTQRRIINRSLYVLCAACHHFVSEGRPLSAPSSCVSHPAGLSQTSKSQHEWSTRGSCPGRATASNLDALSNNEFRRHICFCRALKRPRSPKRTT